MTARLADFSANRCLTLGAIDRATSKVRPSHDISRLNKTADKTGPQCMHVFSVVTRHVSLVPSLFVALRIRVGKSSVNFNAETAPLE